MSSYMGPMDEGVRAFVSGPFVTCVRGIYVGPTAAGLSGPMSARGLRGQR